MAALLTVGRRSRPVLNYFRHNDCPFNYFYARNLETIQRSFVRGRHYKKNVLLQSVRASFASIIRLIRLRFGQIFQGHSENQSVSDFSELTVTLLFISTLNLQSSVKYSQHAIQDILGDVTTHWCNEKGS